MISETWTYASANSVTYAGDLTSIYSAGMRVRLTQGAVKYFVIVSVVYSSPNTTITLYGGGTYTLTNDPISSHDATAAAIPQGFPTALLRANTVIDGFCPVLPDNTAKFLRGDGGWEVPGGAVTNGDNHDHNGGDGAQIYHGGLSSLGNNDHPQYILHSLATAANDFLVASGTGAFVKKTIAEVKTALGLGSAAYTASADYAVAAKGVTNGDSHDHNGGAGAQIDHGGLAGLGDDDHTQYIKHSLATAANDMLMASGAGAFVKKTLAEVKTALGLGSAAYTASADYAVAAKGVTNGDSHNHVGGDGGQVDHGGLAGLGDDDHTQYIKHSLATAANDMLMASEAGVFVKKTIAQVKTALGLGSAAYTASADYAIAAKGVTNGDSHNHVGGDGGQVDHGDLAGLADDDHGQYLLRTEYANGWIAAPALTFGAADAPTYTVTCSGDYSAIIMPGMRMKMTQGAAIKYFIVTKVSYSNPNTTITLYGGTDYTLGSTITLPYYSMLKAPAGFPMSPNKWSTKVTDTTQRSQASPTDSTWYNLGSLSMAVPIGSWYLSLRIYAASTVANVPGWHVIYIALSTSTISATNSNLWTNAVVLNPVTVSLEAEIKDVVDLTAKTSYYPIMERLSDASGGHIYFYNDINAMVITALCAYL